MGGGRCRWGFSQLCGEERRAPQLGSGCLGLVWIYFLSLGSKLTWEVLIHPGSFFPRVSKSYTASA